MQTFDAAAAGANTGPTVSEVRDWLIACAAAHLRRPADQVAADVPLVTYGLDSVTALSIGTQAEDHFGVELEADALWEHPTVDALAEVVVAAIRASEPA